MRPTRRDDDAVVDLLDVILRDGVVLQADVIITVADVPLVGISLRAAIAGMATMSEYGLLQERTAGEAIASARSRRLTQSKDDAERPTVRDEG